MFSITLDLLNYRNTQLTSIFKITLHLTSTQKKKLDPNLITRKNTQPNPGFFDIARERKKGAESYMTYLRLIF